MPTIIRNTLASPHSSPPIDHFFFHYTHFLPLMLTFLIPYTVYIHSMCVCDVVLVVPSQHPMWTFWIEREEEREIWQQVVGEVKGGCLLLLCLSLLCFHHLHHYLCFSLALKHSSFFCFFIHTLHHSSFLKNTSTPPLHIFPSFFLLSLPSAAKKTVLALPFSVSISIQWSYRIRDHNGKFLDHPHVRFFQVVSLMWFSFFFLLVAS